MTYLKSRGVLAFVVALTLCNVIILMSKTMPQRQPAAFSGTPPGGNQYGKHSREVLGRYNLARLIDQRYLVGACKAAVDSVGRTQVYLGAKAVNVSLEQGSEAFHNAETYEKEYRLRWEHATSQPPISPAVIQTLDDLKELTSNTHLKIHPQNITATAPLSISNLSNVTLDFQGASVKMAFDQAVARYMITIIGCTNIVVQNLVMYHPDVPPLAFYQRDGDFKAGHLLVYQSQNVTIKGCTLVNSPQAGMTLSDSAMLWVVNNTIADSGAGGVIIHGNLTRSLVQDNLVVGGTGLANWHAGIVLTYRDIDILAGVSFLLSRHLHHDEAFSLLRRKRYPFGNVLLRNTVRNSRAQGIYLDGCIGNALIENEIQETEKEGLCLDGGSTSNVLYGNLIRSCGRRGGQAPHVLKQEVPDDKVGSDNLTIYKLPGVSIDNGLYNIIVRNEIVNPWGGGIKAVRTCFYNVIVENLIMITRKARKIKIRFPGVMLLADPSDDHGATDIDYLPSIGNTVAHNIIIGKNSQGIELAAGSVCNQLYANTIAGFVAFAYYSSAQQVNFVDSTQGARRITPPRLPHGDLLWPHSNGVYTPDGSFPKWAANVTAAYLLSVNASILT